MVLKKLSLQFVMSLAVCVVMGWSSVSLAKQATIRLDDGREITGEMVSENEKEVVLEIAGVRTTFPRANVTALTYLKSIAEQYQDKRAKIADDDLEKRYELVRWLFESHEFKLAKSEISSLITQFPRDGRLEAMDKLIDARVKLLQEQKSQDAKPETKVSPTEKKSPTRAAPDRKPVNFEGQEPAPRLNDDQVNVIRVYEVNPSDHPNVQVPNEVMESVYKKYAGEQDVPVGIQAQRQALGAEGWRKLQLLFSLRAREFYSQVKVFDDPKVISDFRSTIHTRYVLSYCASNACHGGKDAGNFFLFRFQPASEQTVYTNYYILNRYSNKTSYMIDREKPQRSLLLQYALPKNVAVTPHPDVKGWRPLIQTLDQDPAPVILNWIQSLGIVDPKYPITYNIPHVDKDGNVNTNQVEVDVPAAATVTGKRGEVSPKSSQ